jgi:uncharacterized protein YbaR (Trm112 family)
MPIRKEVLDILACPQCRGKLDLIEKEKALTCTVCRLLYEIRNGIPVMLTDQAVTQDNDQPRSTPRLP